MMECNVQPQSWGQLGLAWRVFRVLTATIVNYHAIGVPSKEAGSRKIDNVKVTTMKHHT